MKTLFVLALSLSLSAASAQTTGGYHITKKIPVAGQGSWDYLAIDEGARRLYVSHGTQVEVLAGLQEGERLVTGTGIRQ